MYSHYWQVILLTCLTVPLLGCGGGDTMADYVDKAKKTAQDAGTSIKKSAQDAGASIKKSAQDAGASIKKTAQDAGASMKKTSESLSKSAKETAGSIKEAANQTTSKIGAAASQAKEALSPSGHLSLPAATLKRIESCYAKLSLLPGQPAVLSIRTAKDPSTESFPSAFISARFQVTDAAALKDQTADGALFVAVANEGDVWKTSQPIKVLISSVDARTVSGRISGGELLHVPSGKTISPQGDFIAVLETK